MKRQEKLDIILRLLAEGGGKFSATNLLDAAGSHRRARSALFLSRKNGVVLEAVRDSGRVVISYVAMNFDPKEHSWCDYEFDPAVAEIAEVAFEEDEDTGGWKKREEYNIG